MARSGKTCTIGSTCVPSTIPPLRERIEDIPLLVWAFIDEFARALDKRIDSVSKDSLAALQRYGWPGNVRELRNVIERAVIFSSGTRLSIEPPTPRPPSRTRSERRDDVEIDHVRHVLEETEWRIRGSGGAAERLGMKPTTLESRMRKLGIQRPEE